jgi:hypothetical protein
MVPAVGGGVPQRPLVGSPLRSLVGSRLVYRLAPGRCVSRSVGQKGAIHLNSYYVAAGTVAIIVGFAHSVLGEVLVFRRMRRDGLIPTDGGTALQERHVRIIWASWHALTVLGWLVAAILFWLAAGSSLDQADSFLGEAIAVAMVASSGFVLIGTKGKHPGWIGLLAVAILVLLGSNQ